MGKLRFAPPGRMVDVGGHRLHLQPLPRTEGRGPSVVFDAALGGTCLGWVYVQRAVAEFAATFSYDRAGLGWSEAGPRPRTLGRQAEELHRLLHTAGVPGPFVLVGHSLGGLVVRGFAAAYPAEVAGLVLVDAPSLCEWAPPTAANQAKLEAGIRLARRGAMAARCGLARFAAALIAAGALRLAAACATVASGGRLRHRGDFNLAPAAQLPDDLKPVMRDFWIQPRFYDALASQMETLPEAAAMLQSAPPLGDVPLRVLSAADASPVRLEQQEAVAAQSRRGQHRRARHSGHWIPLEEPELVVSAVRELVAG